MQERESIRKGFNRLSPFYDGLAFMFFGRSLWRAQSHFIPSLPRVNNVLIIGGGTGKILTHLLHHNIADHYYYLDISDAMVKRAGEKVRKEFPSQYDRITFRAGTVDDIPNEKFDIVITPFVLDMIPNDQLLTDMQKMGSLLKKNGAWLFSDFNYPEEKGMKRELSKMLIGSLYFLFRIACSVKNKSLPEIGNAFEKLGYKIVKEKYFLGKMLVSRLYSKA